MFSDLECDYINPIDLCSKLNMVRISSDKAIYLLTAGFTVAVCRTRNGSTRSAYRTLLTHGAMGIIHSQRATIGI